VVNGIANHEPAEALAVVDDVVMRGHDLRNFCRDLLAHFRDLLVSKVSGSDELLESAICDRDELKRQSELFSEADLVRFFHSLAETETLLKTAAHPRYQLEIGLVKLMEMRRLESLSQLLERLSALEESIRAGKTPAGKLTSAGISATAVSGTKSKAAPSSRASASSVSASSSRGSSEAPWEKSANAAGPSAAGAAASYSASATKTALESEVKPSFEREARSDVELAVSSPDVSEAGSVLVASEIEQLKAALEKRRKMFLVTALEGARNASLEGIELCLEFAPDAKHLRDTLAKSENVKILREVCKEVTGRHFGVRFVISDAEAGDAPPSKEETERREKQSLREKAEKDPTVQQMLRTFRGEIVDVKRVDPAK
jgi:DNA polymerase III gamma/tau subunit